MGLVLTLFVDGLRLFENHLLAAPSLLLVPAFLVAERITEKRLWDYWDDTNVHCLTILIGGLLYGLVALPVVRSWARKHVARP
jgi:hypothetical protein